MSVLEALRQAGRLSARYGTPMIAGKLAGGAVGGATGYATADEDAALQERLLRAGIGAGVGQAIGGYSGMGGALLRDMGRTSANDVGALSRLRQIISSTADASPYRPLPPETYNPRVFPDALRTEPNGMGVNRNSSGVLEQMIYKGNDNGVGGLDPHDRARIRWGEGGDVIDQTPKPKTEWELQMEELEKVMNRMIDYKEILDARMAREAAEMARPKPASQRMMERWYGHENMPPFNTRNSMSQEELERLLREAGLLD